jgi:hypothetical protein
MLHELSRACPKPLLLSDEVDLLSVRFARPCATLKSARIAKLLARRSKELLTEVTLTDLLMRAPGYAQRVLGPELTSARIDSVELALRQTGARVPGRRTRFSS